MNPNLGIANCLDVVHNVEPSSNKKDDKDKNFDDFLFKEQVAIKANETFSKEIVNSSDIVARFRRDIDDIYALIKSSNDPKSESAKAELMGFISFALIEPIDEIKVSKYDIAKVERAFELLSQIIVISCDGDANVDEYLALCDGKKMNFIESYLERDKVGSRDLGLVGIRACMINAGLPVQREALSDEYVDAKEAEMLRRNEIISEISNRVISETQIRRPIPVAPSNIYASA